MIRQLEQNQNTLNENMAKQYTLSSGIVSKFNTTVVGLYQNEVALQKRVAQIETFLNKQLTDENSRDIADTLLQILFTHQSIERVLDELVTAITFTKLKLLYHSIITTSELLTSLLKVESLTKSDLLAFKVNNENLMHLSKLIRKDSYIFNHRLVFILNVPIYHKETFDLFKLYPIPIWHHATFFRLILPESEYVLLSKNRFAREKETCKQINRLFLCQTVVIKNANHQSCEVNLITKQNLNNCSQEIKQPQIEEIENTEF